MAEKLTIATWNINSVRLRLDLVLQFLRQYNINVLCLQETKCVDALFPERSFIEAGYPYLIYHGEKSYNGVAIIANVPLLKRDRILFCGKQDCRHISCFISYKGQEILLHNFYVPAGGDVPDVVLNEKFAHKLQFLGEMENLPNAKLQPSLLLGDLNIAPLEADVWSHKQLLGVVSHTPVEVEALNRVMKAGDWVDVVRKKIPEPHKIYSWWSYRALDWQKTDRGRRLDHIWASSDLIEDGWRVEIAKNYRGVLQPSDHVPVIVYM